MSTTYTKFHAKNYSPTPIGHGNQICFRLSQDGYNNLTAIMRSNPEWSKTQAVHFALSVAVASLTSEGGEQCVK